jgi:hypothetical protein
MIRTNTDALHSLLRTGHLARYSQVTQVRDHLARVTKHITDTEPNTAPLEIKFTYRPTGYYGSTARSRSIIYSAGRDDARLTVNLYTHQRHLDKWGQTGDAELTAFIRSIFTSMVWTISYHQAERRRRAGEQINSKRYAELRREQQDTIVDQWLCPLYNFIRGHANTGGNYDDATTND